MTSLPQLLTQDQLEVHYRRLIPALREERGDEVIHIIYDLGFEPSLAHHLSNDYHFREQTIAKLYNRLGSWDVKVDAQPTLETSQIPPFNKEFFMQRMAIGDLNLQDLALMAAPGGICYLSQMLDLPLTNQRNRFLRNYSRVYYTRWCQEYVSVNISAFKAGKYRDIEMIERKYLNNLPYVLAGMVNAGHLDLLKLYIPRLTNLATHIDHLMTTSVGCDRMEIYQYLSSIYPGNHATAKRLLLVGDAAMCGRLEFFRLFLDTGDLPYRAEWSHYAASHDKINILEELEVRNMLDVRRAIHGAIKGGNMYILNKYRSEIKSSIESSEHAYAIAKNAEVCQILHDCDVRIRHVVVFQHARYRFGIELDVLRFILNHVDLLDLQYEEASSFRDELKQVFTPIICGEDAGAVALMLDHPSITKYQPYAVVWDIVTAPMEPENIFVTQVEFMVEVAQMLVDRGFVFDAQAELERPDLTMQMRRFVTQH